MRFKLALFILVVLVLVVINAPASLLDFGLLTVSGNVLRLSDSQGSLWHGRGVLVARDANGRDALPLMPLAWRFKPLALLHGELLWASAPGSGLRGEWAFDRAGFRLRDIAAQAPAAIVFPIFSQTLTHVGWSGDLAMQASDWRCRMESSCEGVVLLQWRNASSALLPGQRLGDYEIRLNGDGKRLRIEVQTLKGEIRLSGKGTLAGQGLTSFDGRIDGAPAILNMLPNIAAGLLEPEGTAGGFIVHYP